MRNDGEKIPAGIMNDMGELEAQVREELESILSVLETLTGLRSQWNGILEIVPNAGFNGSKSFSCIIRIDEGLATHDIRWRTLIHEALHTFSVGFSRTEYDKVPGWEEGVVEQLQRLLRPAILSRLGVSVAEDVFWQEEVSHLYNEYIEALEAMRQKLEKPAALFYVDLGTFKD